MKTSEGRSVGDPAAGVRSGGDRSSIHPPPWGGVLASSTSALGGFYYTEYSIMHMHFFKGPWLSLSLPVFLSISDLQPPPPPPNHVVDKWKWATTEPPTFPPPAFQLLNPQFPFPLFPIQLRFPGKSPHYLVQNFFSTVKRCSDQLTRILAILFFDPVKGKPFMPGLQGIHERFLSSGLAPRDCQVFNPEYLSL